MFCRMKTVAADFRKHYARCEDCEAQLQAGIK